jgi:glycosyltransferase involved in cell wall biosynthesis
MIYNRNLNILFVKQSSANLKFILNDINILKNVYCLKVQEVKTNNKILLLLYLIKQFFSLAISIFKTHVYYIWFSDYHSFLPVLFAKLFNKKSIICAGGYEATFIPEIDCGVYTNESLIKKIRRYAVEFSLKNCSIILPVNETLIENENTYLNSNQLGMKPLRDGIKNMIPGIKTKMRTVYLGYDDNFFKKMPAIPKENIVVSAGLIPNDNELKRKGFDILIEAAKEMKDTKFVLIGLNPEYIAKFSQLNLQNLELMGVINYDKLIEQYSRAKVFAQISLFEGMPSTICEAMLCECVPVGSNINGIPKIIGNTGFIVKKRSISEVISCLKAALDSHDKLNEAAREYIKKNFTIKKREIDLLNVINDLLRS